MIEQEWMWWRIRIHIVDRIQQLLRNIQLTVIRYVVIRVKHIVWEIVHILITTLDQPITLCLIVLVEMIAQCRGRVVETPVLCRFLSNRRMSWNSSNWNFSFGVCRFTFRRHTNKTQFSMSEENIRGVQSELASRLFISDKTVSKWERGGSLR